MITTILLSGGLDSTVLLHYLIKKQKINNLSALSFSYGQRHTKELECAQWHTDNCGNVKEHKIISLDGLGTLLSGSSTLLEGGGEVPDLDELSEEQLKHPPTYVPNRNMIMLSIAAAFAESRASTALYYAAQAHDRYSYWDCSADFVNSINKTLALNKSCPVKVEAPFVNMKKYEVVSLGAELDVDFSRTWSCYRGGTRPCGTCPTCKERQAAFQQAQIEDPLL